MLDSIIMDYMAAILLCPAIIVVFIINIYTWKKDQPAPLTFNKMVKQDLDELFEKINSYYQNKTDQGVQFSTIDGHFWLEIHLKHDRKIPEFEFNGEQFQLQAKANLDFILSLANVSSRGRSMLIRDINRMEEHRKQDNDK